MAIQYGQFTYDYKVDGVFIEWLEAKDDDGWELVDTMLQSSVGPNQMICLCIFRKKEQGLGRPLNGDYGDGNYLIQGRPSLI